MIQASTDHSLGQTIAAIEALDLEPIKFKARRKEDGYGWSPQYADQMERAYKRYLILHAKYPDLTLAPSRDIDRMWHMHILDTRKYAADCEALFGRFLHHFPYLGLRGAADAKALERAFEQMQQLYAQEFGEPMLQSHVEAAWCGVDTGEQAGAAWCGVEPGERGKAAWCGIESGEPARAAWCGVESGESVRAAWCGVEPSGQALAS